jgi:ribonuclease-3
VNTTKVVLLKETAEKRKVDVCYTDSSAGPPHEPEWNVWCNSKCPKLFLRQAFLPALLVVDGAEKGMGIGKTKKVAMEEAARRALVAMGWP